MLKGLSVPNSKESKNLCWVPHNFLGMKFGLRSYQGLQAKKLIPLSRGIMIINLDPNRDINYTSLSEAKEIG
jgi:hypothetical protein